jgi:hypothetical protein
MSASGDVGIMTNNGDANNSNSNTSPSKNTVNFAQNVSNLSPARRLKQHRRANSEEGFQHAKQQAEKAQQQKIVLAQTTNISPASAQQRNRTAQLGMRATSSSASGNSPTNATIAGSSNSVSRRQHHNQQQQHHQQTAVTIEQQEQQQQQQQQMASANLPGEFAIQYDTATRRRSASKKGSSRPRSSSMKQLQADTQQQK